MALTVSVQELVAASTNPLLRVRAHWSRVRLGEVAEVLNGFAFKSSQFSRTEGVPLVRIRDVGADTTDTRYVGDYDPRYVVRAGDLLIGMDGDFNCARWRGKPALLNQRVCKISVDPKVYEPRLLDYVLPGYLRTINEATSSVTVKHLSSRSVQDIPLPLPPIDEQRRIVAEIEKQYSRLDEAVTDLKRVERNLRAYRGSVRSQAMSGALVPGAAPTTWRLLLVGELAKVGTGATPSRSNLAYYDGGSIPWVTSAAVNEPFVDSADECVTELALRQTNLTVYPPGTLLVAMYGEGKTRGKCSELRIAATTNQALAALQCEPAVRPWLKFFLEHNYEQTRKIASGGVQPNLNLGLIRGIRVPVPPLPDQHRIVAEVDRRLSIVREVEAEVEANLKRAQSLRQAILARAFGGAAAPAAA